VLTGAPAVALVLPLAFAWLFGASALYHRSAGRVSPRTTEVLRRLDHSNIFVVIAATYTPLAILGLGAGTGTLLLTLSWVGALLGVLSKLLWPRAPRALTAPVYVAYASLALWFLPAVLAACGTEVLLLLVLGMLAHVLGAAAYGTRKPDLHRDFGHHEVFHACTILGFAAHLAMAAALA
jgi:hemolysin III